MLGIYWVSFTDILHTGKQLPHADAFQNSSSFNDLNDVQIMLISF